MATNGAYPPVDHGPETVQPGLEPDKREKVDQYGNAPEVVPQHYHTPKRQGNPFGLSAVAFGLLVCAITAVVLAAALGGGLGGALSSCQNQKSSLQKASQSGGAASTQTASSASASSTSGSNLSNYSAPSMLNIESLALNCPTINNTQYKSHFNQNFTYHCGVDFGNLPSSTGGNITDIAAIIAYSIEDCIDACSAINLQSALKGRLSILECTSVTFLSASTKGTISFSGGNCWLKNGTLADGVTPQQSVGGCAASFVS